MTPRDNDTDPDSPLAHGAATTRQGGDREPTVQTGFVGDSTVDDAEEPASQGRSPRFRDLVRNLRDTSHLIPNSLEPGVSQQVGPMSPRPAHHEVAESGVLIATDPGPPPQLREQRSAPTVMMRAPVKQTRRALPWAMAAAVAVVVLLVAAVALFVHTSASSEKNNRPEAAYPKAMTAPSAGPTTPLASAVTVPSGEPASISASTEPTLDAASPPVREEPSGATTVRAKPAATSPKPTRTAASGRNAEPSTEASERPFFKGYMP